MRTLGFLLLAAGIAAYSFREHFTGGLVNLPYIVGALGVALFLLGTMKSISGGTIDMTETPRVPPDRRVEIQEGLAAEFSPVAANLNQALAPVMDQVLELVRNNRLIEAIKVVREATGLGLKESKDLVDNLKRRL